MMILCYKEITREQYERAMQNGCVISSADRDDIFTDAEQFGYGIYNPKAYMDDGKYKVMYMRGESCD